MIVNGRDPATLEAVAHKLRAEGLDVGAAAFDVTQRDAAQQAISGLGDIDVLVNNVGQRDRRGFETRCRRLILAACSTAT